MRGLLAILLVMLWSSTLSAADLTIHGGVLQKAIPILITDASGNIVPEATWTLSDINLSYACSNQVETQFNETGDTLTKVSANDGVYWWLSNDVLANCAPPNVLTVLGSGTDLDVPPQTFTLFSVTQAPPR